MSGKGKTKEEGLTEKEKNKIHFVYNMRNVLLADLAQRYNVKTIHRLKTKLLKEIQQLIINKRIGAVVLALQGLTDEFLCEMLEEMKTPLPVPGPMKIIHGKIPRSIQ